jgi:hypothetical protein
MTVQTNDPWAAARDAKPRPPVYWGNLQADAYFVVLEKGIGRLPFDPNSHPMERRVTAVDLSLLCIAEQNVQNPIERNAIAEFAEWTKIVQPSIQALGLEPSELHERFVKVKMVPTGRKYKNDAGETKDATTFKFLKVFADENECIADYLSGAEEEPESEPISGQVTTGGPAPAATSTEQPQATDGNGRNPEKETAYEFLKVLVNNAVNGQTDIKVVQSTLESSLATTQFVAKHFQVDSPETMQLIMEAMNV